MPSDFRDLSLDHTPLGSLTGEQSHDPGVWGKYRLSQNQVDQFWEKGFLSNIPVLNEEQCDNILKDYATFLVSETKTEYYLEVYAVVRVLIACLLHKTLPL